MLPRWILTIVPRWLRRDYWLDRGFVGWVLSGPFEGMHYSDRSVGSAFFPKVLGTYERELHERIRACFQMGVRTVIDVGAAEGYYAVGLAMRIPGVQVVAFETEEAGRVAIDQ